MSLLCRVYLLQKKKKAISLLTHYGIGFSLSLSLSLSLMECAWLIIYGYMRWKLSYISDILSLSLSLSLSHMECARLIMYGCMHWELSYISAILSLSHTTYGHISINHIWNNYCVLEFVVVKTSSVISKVPTQLRGSLVNFCNNK